MNHIVSEVIELELYSMNREAVFVSASNGSILFVSSSKFWDMTPDHLGYVGCTTINSPCSEITENTSSGDTGSILPMSFNTPPPQGSLLLA
jgi:hypothetical protein